MLHAVLKYLFVEYYKIANVHTKTKNRCTACTVMYTMLVIKRGSNIGKCLLSKSPFFIYYVVI